MITERDLREAIAECEGKRNPDASTCIKLAAFYTIKNELFPEVTKEQDNYSSYSFDSGKQADFVQYEGDSEFAEVLDGQNIDRVCSIFDELMESLKIVEPRLYAAVLRKFRE